MISLVIPVYRNSGNIAPLLLALERLHGELTMSLEVVFVVDGSPDDSYLQLANALPRASFRSQLALLSRNFGAVAATRVGLELGHGEMFAVMAADLQEPPELIIQFALTMAQGTADVVVGRRESRADPLLTRLFSGVFWWFFRRFVQPQLPPGGVDVFGCTRRVRDQIVQLGEQNSSLVGLLCWVGFSRIEVPYERRIREVGRSAWTFRKKLRYLNDSIFNFTDLPIRILTAIGTIGLTLNILFGATVLLARIAGLIQVPGYAATVILVTFFGTLNCLGLGILGGYLWRTFENTKARPNSIIASQVTHEGRLVDAAPRGSKSTAPIQ